MIRLSVEPDRETQKKLGNLVKFPWEIKELPSFNAHFIPEGGESGGYDKGKPEQGGSTDTFLEVQQDKVFELTLNDKGGDGVKLTSSKLLEQIAKFSRGQPFGDPQRFPVSIDVPLTQTRGFLGSGDGQHWAVANGRQFGVRRKAHHLLKKAVSGVPDDADNVGVVIVDEGLSADYVRSLGGTYGGGWRLSLNGVSTFAQSFAGDYHHPHERSADGHGNMVARNIVAAAPGAVIYDAPILPPRVTDLDTFSSKAKLMFDAIRYVIENSQDPRFPDHKHWIIVNAWAVATSFADVPFPGLNYSQSRLHRLNASVIELSCICDVDTVFAAGNSGVFDPALHSGPYDRGHHYSIWGANGLPEVFTIGAVRTDGVGIGASSQGPSKSQLTIDGSKNLKPDFSAPAWFVEDLDVTVANTGTSAACAVFAGWLAKLRGLHPNLTSQGLKDVLGANDPDSWSHQTGHTIV